MSVADRADAPIADAPLERTARGAQRPLSGWGRAALDRLREQRALVDPDGVLRSDLGRRLGLCRTVA